MSWKPISYTGKGWIEGDPIWNRGGRLQARRGKDLSNEIAKETERNTLRIPVGGLLGMEEC